MFHAENIAVYALAVVYSAAKRDVAVILRNDDQARFWFNGGLFLERALHRLR